MPSSAVRRCLKKLKEAVLAWAANDDGKTAELSDDFAFFGGDIKDFDTPAEDFEIHPDNWVAFTAIDVCQSQWHLDSKDRKFGLNYLAAELIWTKLGMVVEGEDFARVLDCEKMLRESF